MSDQQKIWFIYLTDHHEGPFTPAEVAEKLGQGVVTPQSLGWKDGMPEWLPIEQIPELNALGSAPAAEEPAAAAPAAALETEAAAPAEDFSLAKLLAQQQDGGSGGEAAPLEAAPLSLSTEEPQPGISLGQTQGQTQGQSALSSLAQAPTGGSASAGDSGVDPQADVWTLRVGDQVTGLYSLEKLTRLAGAGEVPPDAFLWRSGWDDFRPLSDVPEVASARRSKKVTGGRPGAAPRGGIAPITAHANVGDDEPTDTGIQVRRGGGFLDRIRGLIKRKPKPQAAVAKQSVTRKITVKQGGRAGIGKRVATILVPVLLVVGGSGGVYYFFFSSPIPSSLDVLPSDMDSMKAAVKAPASGGGTLFLASAKGTIDDPPDLSSPKFYVASNLPVGTEVKVQLHGLPGTLVNRITFDKNYSAKINESKLAVFERLDDNGKPLPMGHYQVSVNANGAQPLVHKDQFLGGRPGGVYQSRLAKYKEKLQGDYDKEVQELRETIDTLKNQQAEASRQIADFKANWHNPLARTRISSGWRNFANTADGILGQIDQKLKARAAATDQTTYNPKVFQDLGATLSQLQQLIALQTKRIQGDPAAGNPEEMEGLVQAGLGSLEQQLAQVVGRNPLDILAAGPAPGTAGGAPAGAPLPPPQPAPAPRPTGSVVMPTAAPAPAHP
jgi:hypothetical protein